jgi:hypothetical protein
MLDGVCLCVQLVSSLPHQLTSHLVNIIGAGTASITRWKQNFRNPDNVKCDMNGHVTDSKQMTCSGINEFTKGYQFTALLAWGFCGFPQSEYVVFETVTVSKSTQPSPIILRVQLLLKIGIDT